MILQIADWLMEVSCGNEVADRLQNLKPFLLPEMPYVPVPIYAGWSWVASFPLKKPVRMQCTTRTDGQYVYGLPPIIATLR